MTPKEILQYINDEYPIKSKYGTRLMAFHLPDSDHIELRMVTPTYFMQQVPISSLEAISKNELSRLLDVRIEDVEEMSKNYSEGATNENKM